MPATFFDVEDGHPLSDASGFVCKNDTDAITKATVLAMRFQSISLETIPSAASPSSTIRDVRSGTCRYTPGFLTKPRQTRLGAPQCWRAAECIRTGCPQCRVASRPPIVA